MNYLARTALATAARECRRNRLWSQRASGDAIFTAGLPGPGKRQDVVTNQRRSAMPLNGKAFLALLRVFPQRNISKSETPDGTISIDHVNNLATVERPKPKMLDDDCNCGFGRNGSIRPAESNSRHVKHFPLT
jgi:hypothetical protein